MKRPEIDPATIEGFREAMALAAAEAVVPGWELVGGPYCGSVFPRWKTPNDGTLWIPVSPEEDLVAVYGLTDGEPQQAVFRGLRPVPTTTTDRTPRTALPQPPAEVATPSPTFLRLSGFTVRLLLDSLLLCGSVWIVWLRSKLRRPG